MGTRETGLWTLEKQGCGYRETGLWTLEKQGCGYQGNRAVDTREAGLWVPGKSKAVWTLENQGNKAVAREAGLCVPGCGH